MAATNSFSRDRLLLLAFAVLCNQSAVANFPLGAKTCIVVDQPYATTELTAVDVNFTNDTTTCDWSSNWYSDPNIHNYYEISTDWVRFNMTSLSMYIKEKNGTSFQLTCIFSNLLLLHIGEWEKLMQFVIIICSFQYGVLKHWLLAAAVLGTIQNLSLHLPALQPRVL